MGARPQGGNAHLERAPGRSDGVCVVPARRKALLRIVTGCVGEPACETLRAQFENAPADCYPEVTVVVDEYPFHAPVVAQAGGA